jgi:chitin disaccharide deacetylase
MGVLFSRPDLFAVLIKVAHEYHLPFLAPRIPGDPSKLLSQLSEKDFVVDSVVMANPTVQPGEWKEFYGTAIKNLKPGLTEMIVHLGHDDSELQAVTLDHPAFGSAWRQRDYEFVTSPEFKKMLEESHVVLVQWKDLQKLLQ